MKREFFLSALVDFPDDAIEAVYSPESIFEMVSFLHDMGVKRLYWMHYGDERDEFFWLPWVEEFRKASETIEKVTFPTRTAVEAAHRFGMEVVAVIKPYENGISMIYAEGSPEAAKLGILPHLGGKLPCMMKFVREHPEMRIKRRSDDIPANIDDIPISAIRLYKTSESPTRIKKENIQIWTSTSNYGYAKKDVTFDFSDGIVVAPHDFTGPNGEILAKSGDPVRAITLSGLEMTDRFVIVTTDFEDGEADFRNSAVDLAEAIGPDGKTIPISVGRDLNIWTPPSNEKFGCFDEGASFDDGFGRQIVGLDTPKKKGRKGFLAITRGRNEYLPTALCEAYPEVRRMWLDQVDDCLAAGADAIDFRIENHSTHTDDPFAYGFNDVIVGDRKIGEIDLNALAETRGEYFNEFLREARARISAKSKKMHMNLNVEFLRPDPPPSRYLAYPWNIRFDWKKWLDEGFCDEATLRNYQFTPEFVLQDEFSLGVISECDKRGIPINYNRYIQRTDKYIGDLEKVRADGRFQSFIIYEVSTFLKSDEVGGVIDKKPDLTDAIREKGKEWGIG